MVAAMKKASGKDVSDRGRRPSALGVAVLACCSNYDVGVFECVFVFRLFCCIVYTSAFFGQEETQTKLFRPVERN